jgi:hypothetical protein
MKDHNTHHWGRFLIFVSLVICTILLLNIVPKQSRTGAIKYWRYFYEVLPKNSVDVVFLGNSHTQCTIIPEIIDDLLGIKSIDLITPSENIYQTKFEYQEILKYQNPRAVVIGNNVIYGGKNQSELEPFQFSFFDSMPFSLRKMNYVFDFFSYENLIKYFFPITADHADWKTPAKPIKEAVTLLGGKNSQVVLDDQGYLSLTTPLLPGEVQMNEVGDPNTCPVPDINDRLTITEDVLRINASHSSTLLFMEAPTTSNIFKGCQSQIFKLLENHGISHYQLLDNTVYSLLWFRDSNHLTQFGAINASLEAAQILSEKLNIDMNPQALEYYKSYQFKDYTIKHDGNSINVNLIPFDKAASKNLNYQWEVFWNGKLIHKVEIQGGNEFDFALPDSSGNYLIKVTINNPAGSYDLIGKFSLTNY